MKKVDNLKHFPLHVVMDCNPNLIKALNESLATLGFTLGHRLPRAAGRGRKKKKKRWYSSHYMSPCQQP